MTFLGIMQGRLSPPVDGRIQAFPAGTWRDEFVRSKALGLRAIEWVFETTGWRKNPILAAPEEIRSVVARSGIEVVSVTADYFMHKPIIRTTSEERGHARTVFSALLDGCARLGVRLLMLPFVDNAAIRTDDEFGIVVERLRSWAAAAAQAGVQLTVESALPPARFLELVDSVPGLGINYDIGDRASLGFDPSEELDLFGRRIANVHIKDRSLGGGTVPLGAGHADFEAVFSGLAKANYDGPFILQVAREGEEVAAVQRQIAFVRPYLDRFFSRA